MKSLKFFNVLPIIFLFSTVSLFQPINSIHNYSENDKLFSWADSVLARMTLEQKIAQLMVIRLHSDKDSVYNDTITKYIKKYQFGGVCFFKSTPYKQILMTNSVQSVSNIPLMVTIDGEWGLSMRLDSTTIFPRQLALGAIQNNDLIYQMGKEFARQFLRMGIHVNFAPVADVNINSKNPVINSRSFGENPAMVAQKAYEYMRGMEENGLMSSAKHFPGHGDTDSDSHYSLPVIKQSPKRIETIEFFPFKYLIKKGISSIMVGHLMVPAIDSTKNLSSCLSKIFVQQILIDELGFKGLIFTDGLEMRGVTAYFKPGEIEVQAINAGCDIMLLPPDPAVAVATVKAAVDSNIIPLEIINQKCLKILKAKEKWGINKFTPVKTENIYRDLTNDSTLLLLKKLCEASITLLKNDDNLIPVKAGSFKSIASLSMGSNVKTEFQNQLSYSNRISHFQIKSQPSAKEMKSIIDTLKNFELVIIGIHGLSQTPNKNYGITAEENQLIDSISKKSQIIVAVFGNPYSIGFLKKSDTLNTLLLAYNPLEEVQVAAANVITGAMSVNGQLPVTITPKLKYGQGVEIKEKKSVSFSSPLEHQLPLKYFNRIDSFVNVCIKQKVFPGCQIAAVYNGEFVLFKSYGFHDYSKKIAVQNTDIYDLASVTKIMATTLAIMKLYDEDKIDIHEKLSTYLPYLKGSNKENITIQEAMNHVSGLRAWIPFYKDFINPDVYSQYFKNTADSVFNIQICDSMYTKPEVKTLIIQSIIDSPLGDKNKYVYSDLGFILLREVVEVITKMKMEDFLEENFYKPMGLNTMGYNPLKRFPKNRIPPTEKDVEFRKKVVQGYVHDPAAALLGGISGHAGLFSNAYDVAMIAQMFLNEGVYNDKRYLKASTVRTFTAKTPVQAFNHRRGLGFDKPVADKNFEGPCSNYASMSSFGHSGFTGTFFWVDPEYKLVYVFLSNRVHPDAENKLITKLSVRSEIQSMLYKAIIDAEK